MKCLMRGHSATVKLHSVDETISLNTIGENVGNMLFQTSMLKSLKAGGASVDIITTNRDFSDELIDYINSTYDCFVIPLANAFRVSFIRELRILTSIVKRLKIGCVVIGVGAQSNVAGKVTVDGLHDEEVHDFIDAVLSRSDSIGIRGNYTADYLLKLGFREGENFQIIGCPSLFLYGDKLPVPVIKELDPRSTVTVNRKYDLSKSAHLMMDRMIESFPDHYYIPQNKSELSLLYRGKVPGSMQGKEVGNYPDTSSHKEFVEDRVVGFTNINTWIDFIKKNSDFNFGTRIHGNIAGVLAGVPSFIIPNDGRVLELAEYHGIPYKMEKSISEKDSIFDIYSDADFTKVVKNHREKFEIYRQFLIRNGIDATFAGKEYEGFNKYRESQFKNKPIHSYASLSYFGKKIRRVKSRIYKKMLNKEELSVKNAEGYEKKISDIIPDPDK